MIGGYILDSLLTLFAEPVGVALILGMTIAVAAAPSRPWPRWLLVALTVYAASLGKFRNFWIPEPPPFIGPIDTIISNGRALTFLALVSLLAATLLVTRRAPPTQQIAPFHFLLLSQAMLALKTLLDGDVTFAAMLLGFLAIFCLVLFNGPRSWLRDEQGIDLCFTAIAGVGVLFMALTLFQAAVSPDAVFVARGRLNGTTANAQHAAALLCASAPAILFQVLRAPHRTAQACGWGAVYFTALICLYYTGSRTGLVMMGLGLLLMLYVVGLRRIVPGIITVGGAGALAIYLFDLVSFEPHLNERLVSLQDTRSATWAAMWRGFLSNPLFGHDLTEGQRVGFGESSWLGMASAAGLLGLVPLLAFGVGSLLLIARLVRLRSDRDMRLRQSAVAAGLASLLAGSVLEAYYMSVATAPFMLTCLYLLLGERLTRASRRPAAPAGRRVAPAELQRG